MDWRKRTEEIRIKRKWTQEDLAERVGMSVSTINFWIKGTRTPEIGNMKKLAAVLGVNLYDLLGPDNEKDSNVASTTLTVKAKTIPLISWVQAGQWREVLDNYPVGQAEEYVTTTSKVGPYPFALRVLGDSMETEFPSGSIIIVDPDRESRNGSFVVIRLDEEMEATFKQLILEGARKYLKPLNPRYPILEVDGKKATICGVVVQMVKEYV